MERVVWDIGKMTLNTQGTLIARKLGEKHSKNKKKADLLRKEGFEQIKIPLNMYQKV